MPSLARFAAQSCGGRPGRAVQKPACACNSHVPLLSVHEPIPMHPRLAAAQATLLTRDCCYSDYYAFALRLIPPTAHFGTGDCMNDSDLHASPFARPMWLSSFHHWEHQHLIIRPVVFEMKHLHPWTRTERSVLRRESKARRPLCKSLRRSNIVCVCVGSAHRHSCLRTDESDFRRPERLTATAQDSSVAN